MVKIGKFYCIILIFGRNALFFILAVLAGTTTTLLTLKTLSFAMMFATASFTYTFYHDNIYRDTYNIIDEDIFKKYQKHALWWGMAR